MSRRHDQYHQRDTNQSISLEVTNAVHALEAATLGMEPAKVAVDLARDTLHADERKYELGAEQVFFVLDAQTQFAQAELNLIQAQVSFQLAVTQVDHATGTCWSIITCRSLNRRNEFLRQVKSKSGELN